MKITTCLPVAPQRPASAPAPAPAPSAPDTFDPATMEKAFKKPYESWVPLANAATVGGLVAVPSAVGALEHSLLGPAAAGGITWALTPVVAGLGAGYWAGRSAYKEFNHHPVLTAISAIATGTLAAVATPFLKTPGALWGWQGAAIATGVAAVATAGISAVGIHKANQQIEHHNKLYSTWLETHPAQGPTPTPAPKLG